MLTDPLIIAGKKNTNARSLLDPPIIITKKINPCKSIKPNFNGKEMGSFH